MRKRKSPVETILVLLVESDVIYLVIQVGDFYVLLICGISSRFSLYRQIAYLVSYAVYKTAERELEYVFRAVYLSLCVSVGQTESSFAVSF